MRDWLIRKVATVAGLDAAQVDPTVSFGSYGIMSTDAVGISGELVVLPWCGQEPRHVLGQPDQGARCGHRAEVGMHDDFFELGGNSLPAISIVTRLRAALDCEWLPTHVRYETPTVAAVEVLLDGRSSDGESTDGRWRRGAERQESLGRGAMR